MSLISMNQLSSTYGELNKSKLLLEGDPTSVFFFWKIFKERRCYHFQNCAQDQQWKFNSLKTITYSSPLKFMEIIRQTKMKCLVFVTSLVKFHQLIFKMSKKQYRKKRKNSNKARIHITFQKCIENSFISNKIWCTRYT